MARLRAQWGEHLTRRHVSCSTAVAATDAKVSQAKSTGAMQKFLGRQQISTKRRVDKTVLISTWCTENLRPVSIVGDSGVVRLLNYIES